MDKILEANTKIINEQVSKRIKEEFERNNKIKKQKEEERRKIEERMEKEKIKKDVLPAKGENNSFYLNRVG